MTPEQAYELNLRSLHQILGHGSTDDRQLNAVGDILFGRHWHGAYPAASFPRVTAERPYGIVNTRSGSAGEHWIGVCWTPRGTLLYDSFGRQRTSMIRGRKPAGRLFFTDADAEQREEQKDCGQRCLAWLWVCQALGWEAAQRI